jgi:acyl-coenzyme A synthetase/AMP-(fatty) acid ligase
VTVGADLGGEHVTAPTYHEMELRAHAATLLAPYEVPSQSWLLDEELPRSPTGKLLTLEMKSELFA